jgi:hypothetical protein
MSADAGLAPGPKWNRKAPAATSSPTLAVARLSLIKRGCCMVVYRNNADPTVTQQVRRHLRHDRIGAGVAAVVTQAHFPYRHHGPLPLKKGRAETEAESQNQPYEREHENKLQHRDASAGSRSG